MSAPLIMLHGSFGCGGDWAEILRRVGRTGTTPDLPGHGARFGAPAASFQAVAEEIAASLPAGCDLVGYSLGGRLALAAALHAPAGTVRSLVLESAHPGLDARARVLRLAQDRDRSLHLRRDPAGFLRGFYGAELFASFRAQPYFEGALAERTQRAQRAPAALASTYAALSPGQQPELAEGLLASGIPTLVVVGELDKKYADIGDRLVAAAAAGVPIRLTTIQGAGHNVHMEKPREYAAALSAFWGELP